MNEQAMASAPDVQTRDFTAQDAMADLRDAGRLVKRRLPCGEEIELVEKAALCRGYDPGTRKVVVVASDGSLDRMGDRIDPGGWRLDSYRNNPVVLIDHWYGVDSIVGQADVRVDKGRLLAEITLDDPAQNDAAQRVAGKLGSRSLRTVSVGFKPSKRDMIRDEEDRVTGFHFREQELLEISFVAVPANPNALVVVQESLEPAPSEDAPGETLETNDDAINYAAIAEGVITWLKTPRT